MSPIYIYTSFLSDQGHTPQCCICMPSKTYPTCFSITLHPDFQVFASCCSHAMVISNSVSSLDDIFFSLPKTIFPHWAYKSENI